ncbi:hypothetical protein STEG23_009698, partial [Scotinomys teguina]
DVLGGVLITAVLIAFTYPAWTLIDSLDSASPLFPVCVIVVPFFLCYNYPVSDYYSPTRADTTTIVAAGAGRKTKKNHIHITCSKVKEYVKKMIKMSKGAYSHMVQSHNCCSKVLGHQAPHSHRLSWHGTLCQAALSCQTAPGFVTTTLSCTAIFNSTSTKFR